MKRGVLFYDIRHTAREDYRKIRKILDQLPEVERINKSVWVGPHGMLRFVGQWSKRQSGRVFTVVKRIKEK